MSAHEKGRCPYCSKRVALTRDGKLYVHTDKETGRRCAYSGGRPS